VENLPIHGSSRHKLASSIEFCDKAFHFYSLIINSFLSNRI
jgi:hypothetical protein